MPFDLYRNPFHLLGASLSDSLDVLQEKHDDAVLDGDHDESSLADALRRLTSPKNRIEAELSWILDQSAAQTRELLALLRKLPKSAGERDDWDSKVSGFSGLSKANLLADMASRIGVGEGPLSLLCDAWDQISVDAVEASLADLRRKAGQARPDRDMLATALEDLRRVHAIAALAGMASIGGERRLMTALAERAVKRNQCGKFLSQLAERYDTASEPALAAISTRLKTLDAEVRATPGTADAVAQKIRSLLADWDEINQPIQLLEQLRGHEEGRSRKLAQDLRSLAIWLANEEGRHEPALTITEALLETFPELDQTAAQLAEDAKVLRGLIAEGAKQKPLRELERLCALVRRDRTSFIRAVREEGFTTNSSSQVGEIARAFVGAVASTRGLEIEQAPWGMLLELARELMHQRTAGDVGHMMLRFMLGPTFSPTGTVTAVLRAELKNAEAVARKYRQSLTPLPRHTPSAPATRPAPAAVQPARRSGDGATLWWWVMAFGILGVVMAMVDASGSRSPSPPSSRTTTWQAPSATPTWTAPREPARVATPKPQVTAAPNPPQSTYAPKVPSLAEEAPPPTPGLTLSETQLRWCVFEGLRIDAARDATPNDNDAAVDRFNRRVENLNARCGNYRYGPAVMRLVEGQAASEGSRLRRSGRDWALAFLPRAAPSATPATLPPAPAQPAAPTAPTTRMPALQDRASTCARQYLRLNFLGRQTLSVDERAWLDILSSAYTRDCSIDPISSSAFAAARVAAEAERDALQTDALNLLSLRQSYSRLDLRDAAAARRVQTQLRTLGLYTGPIDGAFGRGSVAALRAFKRARPELANDDVWDADTASALLNR